MNVLELPFDQYQRYKIIEEVINILRSPGQTFKILDAGGHPGLINEFLPQDDTFVVDKLECDIPNFQKADILDLPFKDGSFDVVTSVDVLEHIPSEKREKFLEELWRVSTDYILIAAPFDNPKVAQADRILFEFIRVKLGYSHHFLDEHINYGLPNRDATINSLRRLGADAFSIPNGNLSRWLPMMIALFYMDIDPQFNKLARLINSFYNENYYKIDNCEPCYRYAVVASKRELKELTVSKLQGLIYLNNKNSHIDFSPVLGLIELFNLDMIKEKDKELKEIGLNLNNLIEHARNLENITREKETNIENLTEHVGNLETAIEGKERDMRSLMEHTGNLEKIAADREGHINNLTEHAGNLEKIAADREGHINNLMEHTGNLEKIAADREGHINNLTEQLNKLEHSVRERDIQISCLKDFERKVKSTLLYKMLQLFKGV